MQFVLPIIAIIILGVAEISMNTTPSKTPTPTPKEEIEKEQGTTSTTTSQVQTDSSVKIIVTVAPTAEPEQTTAPTNYLYPGAKVVSQSTDEIQLETTDSPQQVTDWYKNYIQENEMNTTSFVTTNTNSNVLNRLVGTGNAKKIDVEIKKTDGEESTKIKILLNS